MLIVKTPFIFTAGAKSAVYHFVKNMLGFMLYRCPLQAETDTASGAGQKP